MKKTFPITVFAILLSINAFACPVCEKQQPKILQGISHGAGPQSNWDYVIVWVTALIVLVTLYYTVKWLAKPGEKSNDHIKRTILDF